jgi:predicted dehydrogenase
MVNSMINMGILGVGRWGPNILRNFVSMEDVRVSAVCDTDAHRLEAISKRYPDIETNSDVNDIMANRKISSVVIATPLATHFPLAIQALESDKHVFVEKPLATTSQQCVELIEIADKKAYPVCRSHI